MFSILSPIGWFEMAKLFMHNHRLRLYFILSYTYGDQFRAPSCSDKVLRKSGEKSFKNAIIHYGFVCPDFAVITRPTVTFRSLEYF